MAEPFGFFSDVPYGPEDFTEYFTDFYTNGIHAEDTSYFQVLENSGMTLTVKRGTAYVDGHFFKPPTDLTLRLAESDVEYPRIDLVVIRCDYINENVRLEVITGEPNAVPTIPEMERNAGTYDLGLAAITVNPNVSEITQIDIKDLRFDTAYCGVVVGKINTIDTTNLFAQYGAEWSLLRAAIGQDEQAIIEAWSALNTTKSVNDIAPVDGNVTITQGDIPAGKGAYQLPYFVQSGSATTEGEITINFTTKYTSPPVVLVSFTPSSVISPRSYGAYTSTITANGVTIKSYSSYSSTQAASAGTVNWIALGK